MVCSLQYLTFSVLIVNYSDIRLKCFGFWILYHERDHQDVREVQRVHYGEFVMRLVGSSAGQMMSVQWTTTDNNKTTTENSNNNNNSSNNNNKNNNNNTTTTDNNREFVMRLVGSLVGQMMSLQWTTNLILLENLLPFWILNLTVAPATTRSEVTFFGLLKCLFVVRVAWIAWVVWVEFTCV